MILFPKYAYKNILGPVILALLCFIGSFFVFNLSTISIVIYSIIGLGFWVIFGVFSGINYFLYRVKNDLRDIVSFGFDITKNALNDVEILGDNFKNQSVNEIFKGVVIIVLIPSVT